MGNLSEAVQLYLSNTSPTTGLYLYGNSYAKKGSSRIPTIIEEYEFAAELGRRLSGILDGITGELLNIELGQMRRKLGLLSGCIPFQGHVINPDYYGRSYVTPFDLLVSRCENKFNADETRFALEMMHEGPRVFRESRKYLVPEEYFLRRFQWPMFAEMLNDVKNLITDKTKDVTDAIECGRDSIEQYGKWVSKCKPNREIQLLDADTTQQFIGEVYGINTPVDLLFYGARKDAQRIRAEIESLKKKIWRGKGRKQREKKLSELSKAFIFGDENTLALHFRQTYYGIEKKLSEMGLMDACLLKTMRERLSFGSTPAYMHPVIPVAAFLRMPIFGKELGVFNYTPGAEVPYLDSEILVLHEIIGHHGSDCATQLATFSEFGLSEDEIKLWKVYRNPITDEGRNLLLEEIAGKVGLLSNDGLLAQKTYAYRRAIRCFADIGLHSERLMPDKVEEIFEKLLGDPKSRAKAETRRMIESPLDSASYYLGMREWRRIYHDCYNCDPKRFFHEALSFTLPPHLVMKALKMKRSLNNDKNIENFEKL